VLIQAWTSAKDFLAFSPKFDCFRTKIQYAQIEASSSPLDEVSKLPNLCDIEEITEKFIYLHLGNVQAKETPKKGMQGMIY